ncbi:MAG TPA: NADH:flavin oxidoreductase [Polyangiaceae bacterium]|jgi:2,4-dienoyl-CoA reductase-like NADH-dependent reductase (Old Yellow Enzyme family)
MSTLFTPLTLRSMTLPNRILLPAMVTRLSGEDGLVNDDIRGRYVRYAKGGAGLIVVEAMAVHQSKSGPLLRISSDDFKPGLADLAKRCHDAGPGKIAPQIIHFLKIARSGWRQTVDMLSAKDIDDIVDAYGAAAVRARECGFDGVELHMAHAYTLSSFLSRLNPRRDAYGGTLENRLRLPVRVLERVRAKVGDDFPVGVRFLGEECIRNGYTVVEAGPIAVRLARAGADYISLSAGGKFEDARHIPGEPLYPYTGYSGDRCMPGSNYPDGANLYIPEAVRACVRAAGLTTPIAAAGKIGSLALAEQVLDRGQGDLVAMARSLLADPDLPKKWQAGREAAVVRCVYGNVCKALDENFRRVDCTLWPKRHGHAPESEDTVPPAWPASGPELTAEYKEGRVLLRWKAATDNEQMYGYQIFRGEGALEPTHHASARAASTRFEDARVIGGEKYTYAVRPYDLAGNRGPLSEPVTVEIPSEHIAPEDPVHLKVAKDPGAIEGCVATAGPR